MRRLIALAVIASFVTPSIAWAVDSKGAAYFGGTVKTFGDAKDLVEGTLDTRNEDALIFSAKDTPYTGRMLSIPYKDFVDLEFGQKAGRRVGAAAATTILVDPIGLLTLFSKKKKHYLTVAFKGEDGKDQVAVLELGKDIVRATIPIVETRSGKKVRYQDDDAKKSVK